MEPQLSSFICLTNLVIPSWVSGGGEKDYTTPATPSPERGPRFTSEKQYRTKQTAPTLNVKLISVRNWKLKKKRKENLPRNSCVQAQGQAISSTWILNGGSLHLREVPREPEFLLTGAKQMAGTPAAMAQPSWGQKPLSFYANPKPREETQGQILG